jgi:hypothetical protein
MFTQPLLCTAKSLVISIAMAAIIYPMMYEDGVRVAFVSSCFHSMSLTQVT